MKKGFTLIELLVSLVIISVTMVFISVFVLNLKDEKGKIVTDIPQLVDQAAISKELNDDARLYGIRSIECESGNKKCRITYINNKERSVEINNDTIKYTEGDNVIFIRTLNSSSFSEIRNESSTIGSKKLYKYVIDIYNSDNDIEVYYYGD